MRTPPRLALLFLATFTIFLVSMSFPAFATTYHKHHSAHKVLHKKNTPSADVKTAQTHLAHLGYYAGKIDGQMGPQTKAGLRDFQNDNRLRANGLLTPATRKALAALDKTVEKPSPPSSTLPTPAPPPPDTYYPTHPDFYGHVDQQFADPMLLAHGNGVPKTTTSASQPLPSRFAQVSVSETASANMKTYNVAINGQPILQAANQPSVIGVSQTYDLGSEDVILFSTYNAGDTVCPYKVQVLAMNNSGNRLLPIDDCTRGYQAHVAEGSLFVIFPEVDDQRDIGATWRYENGDLEKL